MLSGTLPVIHIGPSNTSEDSYIVYVSADGDDTTGATYTESVFENVFEPDYEPDAFATFDAAYDVLRDGYADYILFKRGDTFSGTGYKMTKFGPDGDDRFVFGAYGTTGDSPLIECGANAGIYGWGVKNLYVLGLDFYAHTRDPDNENYSGLEEYDDGGEGVPGDVGFGFHEGDTDEICHNLTVEGCRFRFFNGNQLYNWNSASDMQAEFRRCVILSSYTSYEGSHCQGFFRR